MAALQQRKLTQALLTSATVIELKAGVLHLTVSAPSIAKRVMDPANVGPLRAALKSVLGVDWGIRCEAATADGPPVARPNLSLVPNPPPDADEEAPDGYDARAVDPKTSEYVVRDPEEAAIELLTQQLGAKRLDT